MIRFEVEKMGGHNGGNFQQSYCTRFPVSNRCSLFPDGCKKKMVFVINDQACATLIFIIAAMDAERAFSSSAFGPEKLLSIVA